LIGGIPVILNSGKLGRNKFIILREIVESLAIAYEWNLFLQEDKLLLQLPRAELGPIEI
jgi:hypothetical protein